MVEVVVTGVTESQGSNGPRLTAAEMIKGLMLLPGKLLCSCWVRALGAAVISLLRTRVPLSLGSPLCVSPLLLGPLLFLVYGSCSGGRGG